MTEDMSLIAYIQVMQKCARVAKRTDKEPLSQYSLTSQNSRNCDLGLGSAASPSESSSFLAL